MLCETINNVETFEPNRATQRKTEKRLARTTLPNFSKATSSRLLGFDGPHALETRFLVTKDYEAMSQTASALLVEEIRNRPSLLLCASTGSSPTETYRLLAEHRRNDPMLFQHLRIIKLDEWGGLDMDDPGTCEHYLREHLVDPLEVPEKRYLAFRSDPKDPEAECRRIQTALLRQGPIDVCVLGLGRNGHIALNEPASTLRRFAHVADLSPSSLQHAMLQKGRQKPQFGLTLGMADILRSRMILLLVSGSHKREVMRSFLQGRVDSQFPGSFLWLHRNLICICDEAATEGLEVSSFGPMLS